MGEYIKRLKHNQIWRYHDEFRDFTHKYEKYMVTPEWSQFSAHEPTCYLITKLFKAKTVLEIGVSRGNSTISFLEALEQNKGHLYSIDILDNEVAKKRVKDCGFEKYWTFIHGDSLTVEFDKKIDILMIDSSHTYEGTLAELKRFEPLVKRGGFIIMHDVHEGKWQGVVNATKEYFNDEYECIKWLNNWVLAIFIKP